MAYNKISSYLNSMFQNCATLNSVNFSSLGSVIKKVDDGMSIDDTVRAVMVLEKYIRYSRLYGEHVNYEEIIKRDTLRGADFTNNDNCMDIRDVVDVVVNVDKWKNSKILQNMLNEEVGKVQKIVNVAQLYLISCLASKDTADWLSSRFSSGGGSGGQGNHNVTLMGAGGSGGGGSIYHSQSKLESDCDCYELLQTYLSEMNNNFIIDRGIFDIYKLHEYNFNKALPKVLDL